MRGGRANLSADRHRYVQQNGFHQALQDKDADHGSRPADERQNITVPRAKLPCVSIFAVRGAEYCGKLAPHDYQLYLTMTDIEHTRNKVASPQTNGLRAFHKTILQVLYQVAFHFERLQLISIG